MVGGLYVGKGKVRPRTGQKAQRGSRGMALLFP